LKKTINPVIILIVFISLSVACYGGDRDLFAPWEFNNSWLEEKVEASSSFSGHLLQRIEILWRYISSVDGDRCPMHPTCSAYSLQVIKKHGFFIGFMMTADRLIHEGSEMDYAPLVKVGDRYKFYDPVSNNDFWWYDSKFRD
jgi:putative component of membrane protein insertase Oxa1/YidC/SpoIIIJ protein YidD